MGRMYVYRRKQGKSESEMHLTHLMGEVGNVRGQQAEEKVAVALQALQQAGTITAFSHLTRQEQKQYSGIDFTITIPNGREMSLQVKSSYGGLHKHTRQHPTIVAVVAEPGVSLKKLIKRLSKVLRLPYTPA